MKLISQSPSQEVNGLSFCDDAHGLDKFLKTSSAAIIWRKAMPDEVKAWIEGLAAENLPSGRVVMPAKLAQDVANELFDMAQTPEGKARDWLLDDLVHLAQTFGRLMATTYICLRLEAVETNSCRKFHLDAIRARLICTYRGTGTQYGIANGKEDPQQIFTVPTGHPMLLRGSLWPPHPATGLVHRSPPIEGTDETRLILVLDPIHDPANEAHGDQIFH